MLDSLRMWSIALVLVAMPAARADVILDRNNVWLDAIGAGDTNGNPATTADAAGEPLSQDPVYNGFTPAFPAHASAHATFIAAAAGVCSGWTIGNYTFENALAPEPTTLFLLAIGMLGVTGQFWRRSRGRRSRPARPCPPLPNEIGHGIQVICDGGAKGRDGQNQRQACVASHPPWTRPRTNRLLRKGVFHEVLSGWAQ